MWHKRGNYKTTFNSGGDLNRQCEYFTKFPNSTIKKINLYGYRDGSERIVVSCTDKQATINFKNLFNHLDIAVEFWPVDFDPHNMVKFEIESKQNCYDVLKEIIKIDPSINSILNDLCSDLEISPSFGITIEELKSKMIPEAIELAKNAQSNNSYELIWQLANIYYENTFLNNPLYQIDSNTLYELLRDISETSPYYAKAQDLCVDLLMRLDLDNQEEKQQYLEMKFRHALLGTRQELTDRLYQEICGYSLTDDYVRNIKGDADILIALAQKMQNLNKTIQVLNDKPKTNINSFASFFGKKSFDDNTDNVKDKTCGYKNRYLN